MSPPRTHWAPIAAATSAVVALALEAWVLFGSFVHGDESRMAAIMIVAGNAVVGCVIFTEVVRRRVGTRSPTFWALSGLCWATVLVSMLAWRLFVMSLGG